MYMLIFEWSVHGPRSHLWCGLFGALLARQVRLVRYMSIVSKVMWNVCIVYKLVSPGAMDGPVSMTLDHP